MISQGRLMIFLVEPMGDAERWLKISATRKMAHVEKISYDTYLKATKEVQETLALGKT